MKPPAASRWGLAAGVLALVITASQSTVALAPSTMRTDYDWTALGPTDAPRAPQTPVPASTPTPRASEAPRPTRKPEAIPVAVAAPTPRPKPAPKKVLPVSDTSLSGTASWYAYVPGGAAAGPRLRNALGRHWRGRRVSVCAGRGTCVSVRLSDWCQCYRGTRSERVIDLDVRSFAALTSPSRGTTQVTVSW